jgi:hypothetical protein
VALKQQALHYQTPHLLGDLAFALLLFSFGYVALQMTFANENSSNHGEGAVTLVP